MVNLVVLDFGGVYFDFEVQSQPAKFTSAKSQRHKWAAIRMSTIKRIKPNIHDDQTHPVC